MRILYVTQWFEPEPAFKGSGFAAALAAAGHDVEVATGYPNYPLGRLYKGYRLGLCQRDEIGGITVDRLMLWPSHDRSAIGRSLNYLSFFISVLIYALFRMRRFDVVYVYHPPMTPAWAIALASRLHSVPFIVDIQDLWPDSVTSSGMAHQRVVRVLDKVCRHVYRRAAHIICQSEGMVERLVERGVPRHKLSRIYNWSTYRQADQGKDTALPPPDDAFAGRLNIVYGGNLGQAQALDSLIEACALATAKVPHIRLHLFGEGIERDRLMTLAAGHGDYVYIHAPLARDLMDRMFERADVLALHLKDDPLYDVTIPSKLQHYLSVGKPIIAGIGGEAAGILRESGAAMLCRPADITALAEGIATLAAMSDAERREMGERGRQFYDGRMSFDAAMRRTLDVIKDCITVQRTQSSSCNHEQHAK